MERQKKNKDKKVKCSNRDFCRRRLIGKGQNTVHRDRMGEQVNKVNRCCCKNKWNINAREKYEKFLPETKNWRGPPWKFQYEE